MFGIIKTTLMIGFVIILIWISKVDIEKHKISNQSVILFWVWGMVMSNVLMPSVNSTERVVGIFMVGGLMFLSAIIWPGTFGGGDIKLMAATGMIFGAGRTIEVAVIAVMTCGVYALCALVTKKKRLKDSVAFGPFLCLGIVAVTLKILF